LKTFKFYFLKDKIEKEEEYIEEQLCPLQTNLTKEDIEFKIIYYNLLHNFKIGYVYIIRCSCGCQKFYIGSTTLLLTKRLNCHINCSKKGKSRLHRHIKEVGYKNFSISLLEKVQFTHSDELRMKESEYYDMLQPKFNTTRPYVADFELTAYYTERSSRYRKKEYIKYRNYTLNYAKKNEKKIIEYRKNYIMKNKNIINERSRKYNRENAQKIKELNKIYKQNNAEKIKLYRKNYRQKNSDKIKEQDKIYRQKNKDKINEKRREKGKLKKLNKI